MTQTAPPEMAEDPIHVLLIEDNPGDVRLVREALSSNDVPFHVDDAPRLSEGLRAFDPEAHQVILLDLGLPDSQGIETFESLRERINGQVPVVILSVTGDEALAVKAVSQGAQDYLVKDELPPGVLPRAIRYAIERQRAISDLYALTRDMQTFIGHIAHDLQSPIATVAGMMETLDISGGELPEEQLQRLIAIVRRQSDRMTKLVSDLLDLLKAQTDVQLEPIDLSKLVDQALDEVTAPDDAKVDLELEDLPPVAAEQGRVERAITNLLSNAYRYGGGHVLIRGSVLGGVVGLAVEDDGEGIPEGYENSVFEPFQQAPNKVSGGTGLGLAIVRRLARGFGGDLNYERSGLLGGSRFVLTLPVWREES